MKTLFVVLGILFLSSTSANAEIIRLKVGIAYDRCETVNGKKDCYVTAPFANEIVELSLNGQTMGQWTKDIDVNGYSVRVQLDGSKIGHQYFLQAEVLTFKGGGNFQDFDMYVMGSVSVPGMNYLNDIVFSGKKFEMGGISVVPKIALAPISE